MVKKGMGQMFLEFTILVISEEQFIMTTIASYTPYTVPNLIMITVFGCEIKWKIQKQM